MVQWWRSTAGHLQMVGTIRWGSSILSRLQYASYHTIEAIPRVCSGPEASAKDRMQGRIPTVVFSQSLLDKNAGVEAVSRKRLLTCEFNQINAILKSVQVPFFFSTRFPLLIRAEFGSSELLESGTVLPIKIHRVKKSGEILNLEFVWAENGVELKVDVPVVFKGEDACPGLQKGGHLNRIRSRLGYLGPSGHIPSKIEVDVSNLDIGDKVFMRDVEVHSSLKLLSKGEDRPICKLESQKDYQKRERKKSRNEARSGE